MFTSNISFKDAARNLVVAVSSASVLAGCNVHNGTGNYVGVVSSIQTDGWYDSCQTWEAQIAAINLRGSSSSGSGNTFHLSIRDAAFAKQIEDAMNSQTPIRVEFSDTSNPWPCHQASNHLALKVETLNVPLNGPLAGRREDDTSIADEGSSSKLSIMNGKNILLQCSEVTQPISPKATVIAPADVPYA